MTKKVIIMVMNGDSYRGDLKMLVQSLTKKYPKLLLVTLNTAYNVLKNEFTEYGIDLSKIKFIEGVTPTEINKPDYAECVFLGQNAGQTNLSVRFTETVEDYRPDAVLFDSLSWVLMDESTKPQFIQNIISKIRTTDTFGILTMTEDHINNQLFKDSKMWVDCIVDFEKWAGRI
ncbi:MAG: hypothetical protein NTU61_05100 [Candidatus Altiarchaeota archaeon]|nr:hypothetical protein [Candidatus Altiarchaeota archaeon]